MCGGQISIITFITFSADIARILKHIGEDTEAEHCASTPVTPCIAPARRSPHALRQHAGHRCRMTVGRSRRGKAWTLRRIGSWQTNHRPTAPTISAPLGEFAELANGGNGTAVVGLCLSVLICACLCLHDVGRVVWTVGFGSFLGFRQSPQGKPVFPGRFTVRYLGSCG